MQAVLRKIPEWQPGKGPRYWLKITCPYCDQIHGHAAGVTIRTFAYFDDELYRAACDPTKFYRIRFAYPLRSPIHSPEEQAS